MNASIVGHGALRNGVIQTGAVALLLGAALAANGVHAAENVERDDTTVRPGTTVRPATPATPAIPAQPRALPPAPAAVPAPPMPPKPAEGTSQRRSAAERADLEAKLHDAQERLSRAASEVAALAAERAADAMDGFADSWSGDWNRRSVIGVQFVSEGKAGAKVLDVSPGGPAEIAGVRAGDVITAINGKDVRGNATQDIVRMLRRVEPDTKVKLRVVRDGRPRDIEVTARPFKANAFVHVDPPPGFDAERFRGPFTFNFWPGTELSGLEVTTLTPQLGRYFGTEKGVLVVRAPKSDVFKLQDGDVILSIDGREPTSGSHISRILSSYQPGEQFTLRVLRDRKQQELVVTCPDTRRNRVRTTWLGDTP